MANPKGVFESFDELTFIPFETDDLFLKDDIDPDANMFNNSKLENLDSPLLHPWWANRLFKRIIRKYPFYLNIRNVNKKLG